jgi:hypothetical protein
MAGRTRELRLRNIHGTLANPVRVINVGGQAVIGDPVDAGNSFGFIVEGSSHLKITGTGTPGLTYGIKVDGARTTALGIGALSTDIEVEFVELTRSNFAGIMAKTDPRCDGSANRGNFTQYNTVIHDNYIHDVVGEGLYIGHTSYGGYDRNPGCLGTVLYPHELVGVKIYRNRIENTGWDALQVSSAVQDVEVHHNRIKEYGLANRGGQDSGLSLGGGTTGRWYNNTLRDSSGGAGASVFIAGQGDIQIFNNEMVDTAGVYVHRAVPPGTEVKILNNTFVATRAQGVRSAITHDGIRVHNNILVLQPGVCSLCGSGITASHNLVDTIDHIGWFRFVDVARGNYHLTASSPARDAGLDFSAFFLFDIDDQARNDGRFDIGADEYASPGVLVFGQDFSSSGDVNDYVAAVEPGTSKFNHVGAELNGGAFSINAGRLQLVRAGSGSNADNDAGLTRFTDFVGPPSMLHVSFDLGVSRWTSSVFQTGAFCLDFGRFSSVFDYGSGGQLSNLFNWLCVTGKGPGRFALDTGGVQSTPLDANGTLYPISYFLNKSSANTTYRGPDGSLNLLRPNGVSVWVGRARVIDNVPAYNGSTSALTDMRLRWGTPDNATWQLDNFVIRSTLPQ